MSKEQLVYRSSDIKADTDEKVLEATFSVYDDIVEIYPGFYERIMPGAFNYMSDVKALINHDHSPNNVIGSTSAKTLELSEKEKSLDGVIHLPDTTNGNDLYKSVKRGDVSKCSIGFVPTDSVVTEYEDGYLETITEAELWEVSVVTFPAYENTTVSARSKERVEEFKELRKREILIKKLQERGVVKNGKH